MNRKSHLELRLFALRQIYCQGNNHSEIKSQAQKTHVTKFITWCAFIQVNQAEMWRRKLGPLEVNFRVLLEPKGILRIIILVR